MMRTTGWMVFLAALGMLLGLMASEVSALQSWDAAMAPPFVGKMMAHLGITIAAFVGGKLIPTPGDRRQ